MSSRSTRTTPTLEDASVIILAGGTGSRLSPYTDAQPKWNLPIRRQPLLQYLVAMAHQEGLTRVTLVRRSGAIDPAVPCIEVRDAGETRNMVGTLFKVEDRFRDDCIISYADILYEPRILEALCKSEEDISLIVDLDWEDYYRKRNPDPRLIAESMECASGRVMGLGQPLSTDVPLPSGQYVGLLRFQNRGVETLRGVYHELLEKFSGKPWRGRAQFELAYMTDLIQEIIDRGYSVSAVPINHGWVEFDTRHDYEMVLNGDKDGSLAGVIDLDSLPPLPTVISAGGVAVRERKGKRELLVVRQGGAHEWRLPKGMQERGEEVRDTATREVLEETGVHCEAKAYLGRASWDYEYDGRQWQEICHFFRLVPSGDIGPILDPDIHEAKWSGISEALSLLRFDCEKDIVRRAGV